MTHTPNPADRAAVLPAWLCLMLAALLGVGVALIPAAPVSADDHRDHEHEDEDDEEDFDFEEEMEEMEFFLVEVEQYILLLEIVEKYHDIVADPAAAGVAAVLKVEEFTEDAEEAVALLEDVLQNAGDPAVVRAIRLTLVDRYGDLDQPAKAREQLRLLIIGEGEATQ
ncbi:MAG: hypothetical protein AAFX76_04530 [Planctomycetota bacterium]